MEFCNNNDLQLIVRAHECVMDGFERFAQGHLITLFSATNYCGMFLAFVTTYAAFRLRWRSNLIWPLHLPGTANNAGAILVLGRDLVVVPKLIHPLPPAISSPETSPERHIEDTWMQVMLLYQYMCLYRVKMRLVQLVANHCFLVLILVSSFQMIKTSGIEC